MDGDDREPVAGPDAPTVALSEPTVPVVIPRQRGPEMYPPSLSAPSPSAPPISAPPRSAPAGQWAAPPPARRRQWPAIAGVTAAVVLVLALAVWIASLGPGGQNAVAAAAGQVLPGRSGAAGNAPTAKGEPTVGDKILDTLGQQATALLAGNHDGYLARTAPGLKEGFDRRYSSLRAMGVQSWKPTLVDKPSQGTDGTWSVLVRFDYCFGQGCTQLFPQVVQTSWTIAGNTALIAKYEQTSEPWDASALQAATGRRVIVAGSAIGAATLQRVVAKADVAADVADRYAHWGPPPKWYIVYLAGKTEWATWWDIKVGAQYEGYSNGPRGIVIHAGDAGQPWLGILLSHELGHVVTVGDDYGTIEDWWLTEGIADYISNQDGTTMQGRLPAVRKFVKNGWDGTITLGPPPAKATDEEVSGRYGVALIVVTCLAKRFGEPKMLDFFGEVVRENTPLEEASTAVLGTEWGGVASACATQVRNS
jgi:hypothetical protein